MKMLVGVSFAALSLWMAYHCKKTEDAALFGYFGGLYSVCAIIEGGREK